MCNIGMELALASGVAGINYYLSDGNNQKNRNKYLERPSSTRSNNQRTAKKNSLPILYKKKHSKTIISSLTGLPINEDDFKHNNMVHFYSGNIKQNVNIDSHQNLLENHTGQLNHYIPKDEKKPFFTPQRDMSFVNGVPNLDEKEKDRFIQSRFKNEEKPINPELVGPGLNKGYISKPSGGFQQSNTRDYVMPKSEDELRILSNPKVSYKARVIKGKGIDKREIAPNINKRRPNTFYKNSPKRYNTTVGSYTKETVRSKNIVKHTNRRNAKSIIGGAGPTVGSKEKKRPEVRKSKKVTFEGDIARNATLTDMYVISKNIIMVRIRLELE